MKTKETAKAQAYKILTYNLNVAQRHLEYAQRLSNKPKTKDVQRHLNRMDKIDSLERTAKMYESRGRKAWANYLNNPLYW